MVFSRTHVILPTLLFLLYHVLTLASGTTASPLPTLTEDTLSQRRNLLRIAISITGSREECWEECTGGGGGDADYCEEICKNHNHGEPEDDDTLFVQYARSECDDEDEDEHDD